MDHIVRAVMQAEKCGAVFGVYCFHDYVLRLVGILKVGLGKKIFLNGRYLPWKNLIFLALL